MVPKRWGRRRASSPGHHRASRQFDARALDISQQTSLRCNRCIRQPCRRWRMLSRCRGGESDEGSQHLRSWYWQEGAVSGDKMTGTSPETTHFLWNSHCFSFVPLVPLLPGDQRPGRIRHRCSNVHQRKRQFKKSIVERFLKWHFSREASSWLKWNKNVLDNKKTFQWLNKPTVGSAKEMHCCFIFNLRFGLAYFTLAN